MADVSDVISIFIAFTLLRVVSMYIFPVDYLISLIYKKLVQKTDFCISAFCVSSNQYWKKKALIQICKPISVWEKKKKNVIYTCIKSYDKNIFLLLILSFMRLQNYSQGFKRFLHFHDYEQSSRFKTLNNLNTICYLLNDVCVIYTMHTYVFTFLDYYLQIGFVQFLELLVFISTTTVYVTMRFSKPRECHVS